MGGWLAEHAEAVIMMIGGIAACVSLLWRGATDTQRVLHRLDSVAARLERVERSVDIASSARAKLHGRIDALASDTDSKLGEVRERVVVLETRAGGR